MKNHSIRVLFLLIFSPALVSCGGGGGSSSTGSNPTPQVLTPWTGLYDGSNAIYLPYANGAVTTASVPSVYAKVGDLGDAVAFGMDTGSTGTVVSPEFFHQGPNDVRIGSGSITYSSSGITWSGDVWLTTVSLMISPTEVAAQARVNVLVINNQSCEPNARDCTPKKDPTGIHFMGVGFNSGSGFTDSVVAAAANNPFTNLTYAKGISLATMRAGWILTNQGVYLGMSSQLTKNFAFVKLAQNPDTINSPMPLWQSAPAAVWMNGNTVEGTSLVDTGVGEMLMSPAAANSNANPKDYIYSPGTNLPTGVTVEILFPLHQQPQPAFYTFSAVNPDAVPPPPAPTNPLTPGKVIVTNSTNNVVFVNTGRNFLQGFNYLYDAVSGYVGYGDNGNRFADPYRQGVPTR